MKIVNAATLANPHVVGLMIDILFDSKSSNTMIDKDYTIKLPKTFKCTEDYTIKHKKLQMTQVHQPPAHSFPENCLFTFGYAFLA